MPVRISPDAMSASEAWAWLVEMPGFGVRTGRIEVYMPAPGIVEVGVVGTNTSHDLDQAAFLSDFSAATFYPLDTTDVAARG